MPARNPLIRILRMILPLWRGIALAALLGLLTIVSSISLMATSAWLISKAALQPSIAELSVAVVGVRFFGISRGIFRYLERLVSHETTFRLLAQMRVRFYQALEPLAPARLISMHSGDLLNRIIEDIDSLQNIYLRAVAPPIIALLTALLFTLFLYGFDPLLAVVMLGFMLAAGLLLPLWVGWSSGKVSSQRLAERGALNAALVDSLQGMSEMLIYGQAEAQIARIQGLSQQLDREERRLARLDSLQLAASLLLTHAAALALLAAAIPRIEGVYLATVALAAVAVFEAFAPLTQAAVLLGANVQAAQRLFEITDSPPAVTDPPVSAPLPEQPSLNIRNLTFRYAVGDARPVLEDLSLDIQPGERIAILGESGSGKSTLVNLLLRFWDYQQGEIRMDGHELHEFSQADARRIFGVMTQRTYLFNTTLRENIRLARPEASDAEVEQAARQAQIHDFILSLPEGYDTLSGEDGTELSGGQRQRVALARVLLSQSPILILDEATANLDTLTEWAVLETILSQSSGRSLLIFTHRHMLLERMDRVYRMYKGRLVPYLR